MADFKYNDTTFDSGSIARSVVVPEIQRNLYLLRLVSVFGRDTDAVLVSRNANSITVRTFIANTHVQLSLQDDGTSYMNLKHSKAEHADIRDKQPKQLASIPTDEQLLIMRELAKLEPAIPTGNHLFSRPDESTRQPPELSLRRLHR